MKRILQQKRRSFAMTMLLATVLALVFGVLLTAEPALADDDHWSGVISARPEGELDGSWTIGERTFGTSDDTVFFFWHGPLDVGSCATVIFEEDDDLYEAVQIASSEMSWCDGNRPGGDDDDEIDEADEGEVDDDEHRPMPPQPEHRTFGTVEVMPSDGISGTWEIGGESYQANDDTEIDEDHGPLEIDACAKVKYREIDGQRVASEIESERAYHCPDRDDEGDDEDDEDDEDDAMHVGILYGSIITFPVGLIGEWNVGGIVFMADADTEFDQERTPFDADVVVKVKFYTDADGIHHATEVESKFAWGHDDDEDDEGDDEDDDRPAIRRIGHAYGLIEDFPENSTMGPIGMWMIGGLPYQVTTETRLNTRHGEFGDGVRVRVKYMIDDEDNRVALKIKTTRQQPATPETTSSYLFSFVEIMPSEGFSGTWQVGNVVLETTDESRFDERWGLLAVGSFVMVEYDTVEETNYIERIKVLIPPGAGEHNHRGRIERIGAPVSGATLGDEADEIWVIDGTAVRVTEATSMDEDAALLDVGALAEVNSYTGEDGVEVATLIRGVDEPTAEDNMPVRVFLPMSMK